MIESMKQALEALGPNAPECCGCRAEWQIAIESLRQAIAELESKEPVAWADHGVVNWIADKQFKHASLLFTHPPQRTWVGLTKEDKDLIEDLCDMMIGDAAFSTIDAILKGKNT